MPSDFARKMVDASFVKNAVEFKSTFESSVNEKIASELRDKKLEMSNSMFKEDSSKDMQIANFSKKKKESAEDQNDIAMKGTAKK